MLEQETSQFSLSDLYKRSRGARILDVLIVVLLCFVVLTAPLPFGAVQYSSLAAMEVLAACCFLLWIVKLTMFAHPDELERFRGQMAEQKKLHGQYPFFHRHFLLARTLRFLTFGKWPRKNPAFHLLEEGPGLDEPRLHYYSVFGYPVRNTGMETLALIFLALLTLQSLPLPHAVHQLVSPQESRLYETAASVSGTAVPMLHPVSISPFHTLSKVIEYSAYFFFYLVIVNVVRGRKLFWALLIVIGISASFQAVYGMYEYLSGHQHIFTYKKQAGYDSASGTFINRNHYAVYLAMALPLLIAILLERAVWMKKLGKTFLTRMIRALETQGSHILIFLSMILVVSAALIFSLSRGGIVFALVGSVVFFALYSHKKKERISRIAFGLFVAGAVLLGIWVGLGELAGRFLQIAQEWSGEASRFQLWKDTVFIFLQFPITGAGAGTFEQIYPMYRASVYEYHFAHAHNDYLQLLAENGFVAILLMVAFFVLLTDRLRVVLSRSLGRLTMIQMGAFCSLLALALHCIFDFALQIPAVAIQASVITGLFYTSYHAKE
jgi:O-antigen ligase